MLQSIRDRAQGWIAWAIVILIAIPFALWGIQSYFGGATKTVVASVDGIEISQREFEQQYQNARRMLRERLGASYDPALYDEGALRQQVLQSMIRETLLLSNSRAMGFRASEEEIRLAIMANPAFQSDGRFDKEAYERALSLQGMVPAQFEQRLRQRLIGSQLERGVFGSEFVTDHEQEAALRLLRQQREVGFVRIEASALVEDEAPSEETVQAYYESHEAQFQSPERVKLEYLVLNEETVGEAAEPSEEALRRRYEAERARFGEAERREVRHILARVASSDEAAEDAARQALVAARERILAGESFADVAREISEDPESAERGGLIGEIEPGLMDPAFEDAAFELEEGVLSDPIRTPFGYHLIRVEDIIEPRVTSFEEVRDQLAAEAARERYERIYYDWAEQLATLAYEAADTLTPAAGALGLEVQTSPWVPRTGGEGILGSPRVLTAAFSHEVLMEGLNSQLIEPERGELEAIVLRVVEHREAVARPLDEVRDELIAALLAEQSQRAAQDLAAAIVNRLEAGESLDDVAGDWPLVRAGMVDRDTSDLPPPVRDLAFSLPHPAQGEASYGSTPLANGDMAVVAVTEVRDGAAREADSATGMQLERDAMRSLIAGEYYSAMLDDMAERAKIERNPELIVGPE